MIESNEQSRKNVDGNQLENSGSAPKPKTRLIIIDAAKRNAGFATIKDVTKRGTGLGIVGIDLFDGDEKNEN